MPVRIPFALLGLFLLLVMESCKPTRYVKDDRHLVVRNVVHFNENKSFNSEISSDDLSAVLKQKPNRKLLGLINFHLAIWNFANGRNMAKKRNQFLRDEVGEAPVLFEPVLLKKSEEQIERYLMNHGHFDATVEAYAMMDKDEVELHYYVFTGPEYRLRKLGYSFEDDTLKSEFINPKNTELGRLRLNRGSVYNNDELTEERARITSAIKNLGYFTFDKIHIIYDIDTSMAANYFDIMVRFRNQRITEELDGKDTVRIEPHLRHRINRVVVNENYEARSNQGQLDSSLYRELQILYINKPYVRPARISRNIFVAKGDYFSQKKSQYTYDRLNSLNNFRFIDIRYEPAGLDDGMPTLDMHVNLTKSPKQAVTLATTGTNRSGNLGISSSVNYKNKNLFKGAEQFDWKVYGGLEWQNTNSTIEGSSNSVINNTPLNTYEFGTQIGITIPDFLLRLPNRELPYLKEPKTNISVAIDRQGRPQYDRNLLNTTFQWSMRLRAQDQLSIAPIDVSVIRLRKDSTFDAQLQKTRNSLLINSYNNHIIAAGRIAYSNSTQDYKNALRNFYFYRVNFEIAGNLLRMVAPAIGLKQESGSYLIDNIAFAQYVKADVEYKKYFMLTKSSKSVFRIFAGSGLPLTNLNALPFERSFFAGGSNGIRAWQARGLGPGNLADTSIFRVDQVGEMQLEFNAEYRFKLIKQLEGALFADIGNIWLMRYDPQRPNANFTVKEFWRAVAIAPGAGFRYNLNFFVIRLDAGLQLKDPSLPLGERWVFQPKTETNQYRQEWRINNSDASLSDWTKPKVTLNLAIDYPF
jgi:hypothetical protein